MKVSRHRLAAVIADRDPQSADAPQLSREIAAYLLSENRTNELDSLLRDVMQLRADNGIVEVVAIDARPVDNATKTDIKQLIKQLYPQAKQIIISEELQPELIGGLRLELANQQLDLSVQAKLYNFKQLTTAAGGISA